MAADLSAHAGTGTRTGTAGINESVSLINSLRVVESNAGVKRLSGAESPTPFEDDEP